MKQLIENREGVRYFTGDLAVARTLLGDDWAFQLDEGGKSGAITDVEHMDGWQAVGADAEDVERRCFGAFVGEINFDNVDDGDALLARLVGKEG